MTHPISHGDSRQMNLLPDRSFITSSPYWQVKDYGCE
jgi:hypothetical protein